MAEEIMNGIRWGLASGTFASICLALWALHQNELEAAARVGAYACGLLLITAMMYADL